MREQMLELIAVLQVLVALLTQQLGVAESPQPGVQQTETEITTSTTKQTGSSPTETQSETEGNAEEVDEVSTEDVDDANTEAAPAKSSGSSMPSLTFNEADFDYVFDGTEITKTETVSGASNILIKNCYVHDTAGDGIVLRDVKNVVITNCVFEDIGGQAAVRGSITGSTDSVLLYKNVVDGTAQNGFNFGQRSADGINHTNLRIIGNEVRDTGLQSSDGSKHAMYVQAQDFEISYNTIAGHRDGNAISVRSSGEVIGNTISGTSADDKPGIRYYSDHQTGPSETLLIEDNVVDEARIGIDLFTPVKRYDGQTGYSHVVKDFVIRNNDVSGSDTGIAVAPAYNSSPFSVTRSGNTD